MVVQLPQRTTRPLRPATGAARVATFRSAQALLEDATACSRRVGALVEREMARRTARDRAVADTVHALGATGRGHAVLQSYELAEALDALVWVLPVNRRVDRALTAILHALVTEPNGCQ